MKVIDFESSFVVHNFTELESILKRRFSNGANSFWLSQDCNEYPTLAVLVMNDLAALHYFPKEGHPGFLTAGNLLNLQSGATSVFHISKGGEQVWVINDAIILFLTAVGAIKEFFVNGDLPKSIQWQEL